MVVPHIACLSVRRPSAACGAVAIEHNAVRPELLLRLRQTPAAPVVLPWSERIDGHREVAAGISICRFRFFAPSDCLYASICCVQCPATTKECSVEIEIYSHPFVTGAICLAVGVIAGAFLRRKRRASGNTDLAGDRDEVNNIGGA